MRATDGQARIIAKMNALLDKNIIHGALSGIASGS